MHIRIVNLSGFNLFSLDRNHIYTSSLLLYTIRRKGLINERKKAYDALPSSSRLTILRLLPNEDFNVDEVAKLVNMKPISVRHHLQSLENAGFIKSYEKKSGTAGRLKVYFQITKQSKVVNYPKRRYLTLSNFVIKTLPKFIGSPKTNELLKKVGKKWGKTS